MQEVDSEKRDFNSEINDLRNEFLRKLNSSNKDKDEKIKELENQIVYLKGRVKAASKNEEKVILETKKNVLSKVIDSLSDEDSKKVIKSEKVLKKVEKKKGKSILTKMIDGLAD